LSIGGKNMIKKKTYKKRTTKRREEDNIFGDVISQYTREDAIRDGELVDVTEFARTAGIKYPTAITRGLWGYIYPMGRKTPVDWKGRLWDVLSMFTMYAKMSKKSSDRLVYKVKLGNRLVTVKAHIGPGDTLAPVITMMLPQED